MSAKKIMTAPVERWMLDVEEFARFCKCSTRHIYRMSDSGRCPKPVKLGNLSRWNRAEVEAWLADGCPSCRTARNGGGK